MAKCGFIKLLTTLLSCPYNICKCLFERHRQKLLRIHWVKPLGKLSLLLLEQSVILLNRLLIVLVKVGSRYSRYVLKVRNSIHLVTLTLSNSANWLPLNKMIHLVSRRQNVVRCVLEINQWFLIPFFFTIYSSGLRICSISFLLHFTVFKLRRFLCLVVIECLCWLKVVLDQIEVCHFTFYIHIHS